MEVIKYRCPSCGFQIFNRRVSKCESCGAVLPFELLFSREQLAALDAEHEKSKRDRGARVRTAGGSSDSGGVDSGVSWDVGNSVDGGGCD
jgi:transcription initiation factor TFIIIB Brf1 subunit/transcription initiation factor TFIIB